MIQAEGNEVEIRGKLKIWGGEHVTTAPRTLYSILQKGVGVVICLDFCFKFYFKQRSLFFKLEGSPVPQIHKVWLALVQVKTAGDPPLPTTTQEAPWSTE